MNDSTPGSGAVPVSGAAPSETPDGYHALQPSRKAEVIAALVALATFTLLFALANQIDVRSDIGGIDPRWWPRALGILGMVLSALLLIVAVTREVPRDDVETSTRAGWIRFSIALFASVAFILLWPALTFIPTTLVYVAALTYAFGARGWKPLVIFPAAITAFLYLLFHTLLKVPL